MLSNAGARRCPLPCSFSGTGMSQLAPPAPPLRVALDDGDHFNLHTRLWLVWWTLVTILVTCWFISLGPIPGVLAVVVAKHVLVALLVMGLGVDANRQPEL